MVQMRLDYLFYLTAHLKRMFSGLRRIVSSYKFIQKLWNLNSKILIEIKKNHLKDSDERFDKETKKFLKKITVNLDTFSYNKLIANLHEMYTFLIKNIEGKYRKETLIKNYEKILIVITPLIPHFASECLNLLNSNNVVWPKFNKSLLKEDHVNIVIQINGKKRGLIKTEQNISEEKLLEDISKDETIHKYFNNKIIKRKIFIKDKLLNIII